MKTKLGLYAGSFTPLHLGHLDVIEQAKKVFDKVILAKGINPEKNIVEEYPFPVQTLCNMGIEHMQFNILLSEVIATFESTEQFDVTLVRGLRSGADLEYEQNFTAFLKGMKPDVKIVAFYCNPNLRHISSSALRGIRKFSESEYEKYVVK